MRVRRRDPIVSALAGLGRLGRHGVDLAVQLDVLRSVGPRIGWQRRREVRLEADLQENGRPAVYDRIWRRAAAAVGAEVSALPGGYLAVERCGRRTVVWQAQTQLDDPVVLRLASDKPLVHELLQDAGLPVARHRRVHRADSTAALRFLEEGSVPIVVKPASGTGSGTGVTCGVTSVWDLHRARLRAGRWDEQLLLEPQAHGHEYRLLFLDGTMIGALQRFPPRVLGDGRSTIYDLIAAENRRRLSARGAAGLWLVRVDLDCLLTLRQAGLTLGDVPAAGQVVAVKATANQNGPADNVTVTDLHPRLVERAATAARLVGLRLASVEVIAPEPAAEQGVILEVNGSPGLHYHYQVRDPENADDVAVPVLDALLTGTT